MTCSLPDIFPQFIKLGFPRSSLRQRMMVLPTGSAVSFNPPPKMVLLEGLNRVWIGLMTIFSWRPPWGWLAPRRGPTLPISASTGDPRPLIVGDGSSPAIFSWLHQFWGTMRPRAPILPICAPAKVSVAARTCPNAPALRIFHGKLQPLLLGLAVLVINATFNCLNNLGEAPSAGLPLALFQVYEAVLMFLLFWAVCMIAKLLVSGSMVASPEERAEARHALAVCAFIFIAFLLRLSLRVSFFPFLGAFVMFALMVLLA